MSTLTTDTQSWAQLDPRERYLLIKTALLRNGVTLTSVARKVGKDLSVVSRVASGARVSQKIQLALCRAIGRNRKDVWG